MVNIPPALTKPFLQIMTPLYVRFSTPFQRTWMDLSVPYQNIHNNFNVQENCNRLVQNTIRIALAVAVFFVYQIAWNQGKYHLGIVGGLAALYSSMVAVCYADPRIFYIANSAWFLYKGLGILKGVEDGRLLSLLLINQQLDSQEAGIFKYWPMETLSSKLTSLLVPFVKKTETPPSPSSSDADPVAEDLQET